MNLQSALYHDASRISRRRARSTLGLASLALLSVQFRAALTYRLSAALYSRAPQVARLLQQINIWLHGADIDPRCRIGPGVLLQHPVGVVIGGGVNIGNGCTLMSNVVLGRRTLTGGDSPDQYPQIGNDVVLGAGACALGRVHIGDRTIVGALAVVLSDIPPNSVAVGNPSTARAKRNEY